jgi:hypothetical protein
VSDIVGSRWYQHGVDTNNSCADCAEERDHCHGTLIVHLDGVAECTEPGCVPASSDRHVLIVDCATVDGGCECVVIEATERLVGDIHSAA